MRLKNKLRDVPATAVVRRGMRAPVAERVSSDSCCAAWVRLFIFQSAGGITIRSWLVLVAAALPGSVQVHRR